MFVERCGSEKPALRLLLTVFLVVIITCVAMAQDAATTPPAAPSANREADTAAQANTGVRPDAYIIGAEDVLSIYVWKEPDMSKSVPVRPDGMISLPLIGRDQSCRLHACSTAGRTCGCDEEICFRSSGDGNCG